MNKCTRCGFTNDADRSYCGQCGEPVVAPCPSCGVPNDVRARLCVSCASAIGDPESEAIHSRARLATSSAANSPMLRPDEAGERKQVTVLCCDLAGSTTLAERLGPDVMHNLLERFFELVLSELHRYDGTVNQFQGDGLMALFADQAGSEDHPRRAVLAALGIQRALAEHAKDFPGAAGQLRLRIGLNSGPVVVGSIGDNLRTDFMAAGDVTHLASQIQSIAEAGWAYASEMTHGLTAAEFEWEKLPQQRGSDRSMAVATYRTRSVSQRGEEASDRTATLARATIAENSLAAATPITTIDTPLSARTVARAPVSYTPSHLATTILTSRSALEGERKQVTVLFCTLAGSTVLAERLGPVAMHALLESFFKLALAEVHRYEGTVNQLLGDGLMALFGAPIAHEDHARRAVLAGIGIQRSVQEYASEFEASGAGQLRLRIALNTGIVVVGKIGDNLRMDYTAVGDVTNLASRLQAFAEPGWVYASDVTQRLTGSSFEWELLGSRKVRGRSQAVTVYRARMPQNKSQAAPERAEGWVRSPFVGRDAEIAALRTAIQALGSGQGGGVVAIIGEPGIGKSRILMETRGYSETHGVQWLDGRAISLRQTLSYWPLIEVLRHWIGIGEEEASAEALAELKRHVELVFKDEADEILPYLIVLLGLPMPPELEPRVKFLDGDAIGRQIFRSLRRLLGRLARDRPLVVALEDLHWSDQSTTELIEHLLPLVEAEPLLFVVTSRPDPNSPGARVRNLASSTYRQRYTEMLLGPLGGEATRNLIENLLEGEGVSALREKVFARAEGNPYFAEEIIRSLIGSGALVRNPLSRRWMATRAADNITIPDSLQGVIAARVDRLDDEPKHLLKIASVIGRGFLHRVLGAVDGAGRAIDHHLAGLEQIDLIRERRRSPELEYWFTHALIQETTYDSILVDRRRALHLQVADCIASLFAQRVDEFAGILAHHYARAAEWVKAQHYLFLAGDQASRMAGNAEALAHYREAVEVYARAFGDKWDPVDRAVLERKVGEALFRRGEHHAAIEHFSRALAGLGAPYPATSGGVQRAIVGLFLRLLAGGFKPPVRQSDAALPVDRVTDERCRIYGLMGWMHYFLDQERNALDVLLLLNSASQNGSVTDVVKGAMGVGSALDVIGLHKIAGRYHRAALEMAAGIGHPIARADAHLGMALHQAYGGNVGRGIDHALQSATAYREAGELRSWGASTGIAIHLGRYRGNFAEMMRMSREVLVAGEEVGDNHLVGWGNQGLAFALRSVGPLDEAIQRLHSALPIYDAMPAPASAGEANADLALCEIRLGRVDDAVARLEKSNKLIAEKNLRGFESAYPHNVLAEAYLIQASMLDGAARTRVLAQARRACRAALTHGRKYQAAYPYAMRVRGTYEWLTGRPAAARIWWQQSLDASARQGTRFLEAQTHLEIGRRTGASENLTSAIRIFEELGAALYLTDARHEMERIR